MIDLSKIIGFNWDDGNARKNEKHDVSMAEAEQVAVPVLLERLAAAHRRPLPLPPSQGTILGEAVPHDVHPAAFEPVDPCDFRQGHAPKGASHL